MAQEGRRSTKGRLTGRNSADYRPLEIARRESGLDVADWLRELQSSLARPAVRAARGTGDAVRVSGRHTADLIAVDHALVRGLPGVGKGYTARVIGHALNERGRSVLFRPAYQLPGRRSRFFR